MIKSFALPLAALAAGVSLAAAVAHAAPAASPGDFEARHLARMMTADTNHDGRISLDEWLKWRASRPAKQGGHGGDPNKAFERMDANHDGYLSADEIKAAAAKAYERRQAKGGGQAEEQ